MWRMFEASSGIFCGDQSPIMWIRRIVGKMAAVLELGMWNLGKSAAWWRWCQGPGKRKRSASASPSLSWPSFSVCVCVCLCIIVGVSDECVPSHLSIFASLCVYFCLEIAFTITITNGSTINTRLEQGASFWRLVRIDERKLLAEANLGRWVTLTLLIMVILSQILCPPFLKWKRNNCQEHVKERTVAINKAHVETFGRNKPWPLSDP